MGKMDEVVQEGQQEQIATPYFDPNFIEGNGGADNYEEQVEEEPVEEEVQEGDEPTEEEEPEEQVIKMQYTDANGDLVEEDVPISELKELIEKNRKGEDGGLQQVVQQFQPYVDILRNSELMQQVAYYRGQGYTDEQIKEAIAISIREQSQEAETVPDFETDEERIKYLVQKEVEKITNTKINPLQNQLKQQTEQRAMAEIYNHNDQVMANALLTHNYNPTLMNQKQYAKLRETLKMDFPQFDLTKIKLTQKQADMIVREGLGYRQDKGLPMPNKTTQAIQNRTTTTNVARQATAPRVLPAQGGIKTVNQSKIPELKVDNVSIRERQKRWDKMWEFKEIKE